MRITCFTLVVVVDRQDDYSKNNNHKQARAELALILAPLEQIAGARVGEPLRGECLSALRSHPSGLRELVRQTIADADPRRTPIGLLAYRIKHRWHELDPFEDGALQRALAWIEKHGRRFARADAEEVLATFGMNEQEAAQARERLHALDEFAAYREPPACETCGAHPCMCAEFAEYASPAACEQCGGHPCICERIKAA